MPAPVISSQQALPATFATTPVSNHPLIDAQVAIDPTNSSHVVAVASYDPTFPNQSGGVVPGLRIWYSTNAGAAWTGPASLDNLADPNSFAIPQASFAQNEHPSVAFDTMGHIYIVSSQHDSNNTGGAIVLDKFSFGGTTPSVVQTLYSWLNQDPAYNPVVGIDTNLASFTDPVTGALQTDTMANTLPDQNGGQQPKAVYVAWNTIFTEPKNSFPATLSRIWVAASDDGGQDFTTTQYVSAAGSPAAAPQLAFTQDSSVTGVPGGVITGVKILQAGAYTVEPFRAGFRLV